MTSTEEIRVNLTGTINDMADVAAEDIQLNKSFVDGLGVDSLFMAEIIYAYEGKFGVSIPDEDSKNLKTIGDAVAYVEHAQAWGRASREWRLPSPTILSSPGKSFSPQGFNVTEVVITGPGAFTLLGIDALSTWEVMLAGRPGMHTLPCDWAKPLPVIFAAEAVGDSNEKLDRIAARRLDRSPQFAMITDQEMWEGAGLGFGESNSTDPDRLAVYTGTGIGGLHSLLGNWGIQKEEELRRVSPFTIPVLMTDAPATNLGLRFSTAAGVRVPVSACASSNEAIPLGLDQIRLGRYNVTVVRGPEDVIHPLSINVFARMQALSRRNDDPEHASRPWDTGRDGFILDEGSVIMVVETFEHARTRGARIYGILTGAGISDNNHNMVQPEPTGHGQSTAMHKALQASGLQPGGIKYINAHGTSTPQSDLTETSSITITLGSAVDECVVTSTKSMSDHLLDSAGVLETFATVMALRNRIVPPIVNIKSLGPELPIDIAVNEPRRLPGGDLAVLNSSLSFGGSNIAVTVINVGIAD